MASGLGPVSPFLLNQTLLLGGPTLGQKGFNYLLRCLVPSLDCRRERLPVSDAFTAAAQRSPRPGTVTSIFDVGGDVGVAPRRQRLTTGLVPKGKNWVAQGTFCEGLRINFKGLISSWSHSRGERQTLSFGLLASRHSRHPK